MKSSGPKLLLQLEGLAVLVAAATIYSKCGGAWVWFAVLFLAPDLSMLGYLAGKKGGAWLYNSAHTYLAPLVLAAVAAGAGRHRLLGVALIWIAHIGFDRLLGYGLKYPSDFKDTHLSRV